MADSKRKATQVLAVLLAIRALTNVGKPLGAGTGLVFFGKLLTGTLNNVMGPAVGFYMLAIAYGMWFRRAFALPMSYAYCVFVIINVALFPVWQGDYPPHFSALAYFAFGVVSIGSAVLISWLLYVDRESLR